MRDYAKVAPLFWTRGSGKRLRGDAEAQVLALYLVTCPSANMIGIYYVPFVSIAHETGLGAKRATEAMGRLSEAGFAFYDPDAELAWVPNMASYQIGDAIALRDNRHKGIVAELQKVSGHRFVDCFYEKYGELYALPQRSPFVGPNKPLASPLQAPPKGQRPHGEEKSKLRAGEEQEKDQDPICPTSPEEGVEPLSVRTPDPRPDEVWTHYVATMKRYRPRRRPTRLRPEDRRAIRKHLDAGLTVDDLKLACEGLFRSQHHLGQNDRSTEYLDIEYALRKPSAMIALAEDAAPSKPSGQIPLAAVSEERVDPAVVDAFLANMTVRTA